MEALKSNNQSIIIIDNLEKKLCAKKIEIDVVKFNKTFNIITNKINICPIEEIYVEYFDSIDEKLRKLLNKENIKISEEMFKNVLRFLSSACTYEEEEIKIKPNLILGFKIDDILEVISSKYKLIIFEDDLKGTNFRKKIKALTPFCKNDWLIYINIIEDKIQYGVFRAYTGLKGLTINQIIFSDDNLSSNVYDAGIISIEVINNHQIRIIGLKKSNLTIDFSLIQNNNKNIDKQISDLAFDVTSNINLVAEEKDELIRVFEKIFKNAYKKLHGSICLVVEYDYMFPNEVLSDGIWLENPINLGEIVIELLNSPSDNVMYEKYYSLTGILVEMMNIDGITVMDNKGNIRGYNVFITQSKIDGNKVVGGARRRAYQALLTGKDSKFIGAYFQSQDGYVSYERMGYNE